MSNSYDAVVIGAGLSGLLAAYRFKKAGRKVLLIEKSHRLGGNFDSREYEGSVYEFGPNTFMNKAVELLDLVEELGLEDELEWINFKDSKRYFYFKDRLVELPVSPVSAIFTPVLDWSSKLRVLKEPFVSPLVEPSVNGSGTSNRSEYDESVYDFVSRRFGKGFCENVFANFFQGIWAGDIKKLSAKVVLKTLVEAEQESGGVLKYFFGKLFAKNSQAKSCKQQETGRVYRQGSKICSFKRGLSVLTDKLGEALGGDSVLLGSEISSVKSLSVGGKHAYELKVSSLDSAHNEVLSVETLDIYIATKAPEAKELLEKIETRSLTGGSAQLESLKSLVESLSSVHYAPVAICAFSIPKKSVSFGLDGFGYLLAHNTLEKDFYTLGSIWSSELFASRTLEEKYLFVSLLGGAKHERVKSMDPEEIKRIALEEQIEFLKLDKQGAESLGLIDFKLVSEAIPQYNLGHSDRVLAIKNSLNDLPGIHLLGNYLEGLSVQDVVKNTNKFVCV